MESYLSIGEIAKMFKLNRQTLHFYDKKGLFIPDFRDQRTNYRKYSIDQVDNLALIIYLRKIGFSVDKIKTIMNSGDIEATIKQFKIQSETLRTQYQKLLDADNILQRKIRFVERKLKNIAIEEPKVKFYPKRTYIFLGQEKILYSNEMFYFFPTIAFYHYNIELKKYETTFGAYLESDFPADGDYKNKVETIEKQNFLCLYYKGVYEGISKKVSDVKKQYNDLKLSTDFICINIVDQFLEGNVENFITEVQIPILK